MPNGKLLKFYYRDLKGSGASRGICYQALPERDIFIRKYIGMDGYEREKWIRRHPKSDAMSRYHRMIEYLLLTGKAESRPLTMRRYFFKRWFMTMQGDYWRGYKPEFQRSVLNELMRMVKKYVTTGKVGNKMLESGTSLDTVFAVLLSSAKKVAYNKLAPHVKSIPIYPRKKA